MSAKYNLRFYLSTAALIALVGAAQAQQTSPATTPSADNAATAQQSAVDEIVVVGQRAAMKSAIATKEKAEEILDFISADDAGKLPDNSVTEVLQRVPGVNMSRIQEGGGSESYLGEGTNITIRGLDSVVSQLNGRDSFSSANGRGLAWEDIPPELMQGVDVYKSEAADLPEGGFGGIINLRTRMPFDYKDFTVNASLSDNYADYSGKDHPGGVALVSDRWSTPAGEFGALFNFAYSDLSTRADGVQIDPYFPVVYNPTYLQNVNVAGGNNALPELSTPGSKQVFVSPGLDFNELQQDRTRTGLYGALQFKPNNDLSFFATLFRSEYKTTSLYHYMDLDTAANQVILAPNSTTTFGSNGGVLSSNGIETYAYLSPGASGGSALGLGTNAGWNFQPTPYDFETSLSTTVNTTTDYSAGGDWAPNDDLDIKFSLQHVDSSSVTQQHYLYDYAYIPNTTLTFSPYGSSAIPTISIPATAINLANSANYGWLAAMDQLGDNVGHENALYADGTYELSDTALFRSLKFGVKLTLRTEDDDQTPYNYQPLANYYATGVLNGVPTALSAFNPPAFKYLNQTNPNYISAVNMSGLFNGQTGLPATAYFPSVAAVETNFTTIHQQLGAPGDEQQAAVFTPDDLSKLRETTETAYAAANFRDDGDTFLGPFRGNIGLRLVAFDDSASGYLVTPAFPYPSSANFEPVTGYSAAGGVISSQSYPPNVLTFTAPASGTYLKGGHSEIDPLPSLNIQFLPTRELHIRLAASEGLSRPTFQQLNPGGTVSGAYEGTYTSFWTGSMGNADLKPETAEQFDGSIEYYFPNYGLAHISPFYKRINNYIAQRQIQYGGILPTSIAGGTAPTSSTSAADNATCAGGNYSFGAYCPQPYEATVTQWFNESQTATVEGVEIGIQKYLDFLPDPFSGLGIDFNYTHLKSAQPGALAFDMLGNRINGLPLTGLSNDTINIAGMYDYGPISLRLAYNYRSSFLVTTAAYQTTGAYNNIENVAFTGNNAASQQGKVTPYALPLFQQGSGTLDGNISYKLADNWSWVLEASNLTKSTAQLTMGTAPQAYNRSWYTADRRFTTVIRATFH